MAKSQDTFSWDTIRQAIPSWCIWLKSRSSNRIGTTSPESMAKLRSYLTGEHEWLFISESRPNDPLDQFVEMWWSGADEPCLKLTHTGQSSKEIAAEIVCHLNKHFPQGPH